MVRGRRDDYWDHTSQLLAKIHNANCTKTHQLREPSFFHPLRNAPNRAPGAIQTSGAYHRSMCAALEAE